MRVLDLFSGIGGFSLGLERAGMKTVAFCEIDKFCQSVLRKHWPEVPIFDDVRELSAQHLTAAGISVDLIAGGFPCQDISTAGKGAGIEGERSGLWKDYARLIGELRPRFVIVENVAALLARGLDRVLGDLAALGYDAEWHCIPACAVGAPHRRDRVWIVAYPNDSLHAGELVGRGFGREASPSEGRDLGEGQALYGQRLWAELNAGREVVADTDREGLSVSGKISNGADRDERGRSSLASSWWSIEPNVGRVAHGIPGRVDRIRALGNAVVPQIPELIGRAIMSSID